MSDYDFLNSPNSNVGNTTSDRSGLDITDEVEVDKDSVNIYGINELVPSSASITIPYMEVMRTNELEYVPYISPYNIGCSSSDSSEESSDNSNSDTNTDDTSDTNSDTNTDSTNSSSNTNETSN